MDETKLVKQMKRIKGQVGAIEKMIQDGRGCDEVLMQLSAAMNSLKSVSKKILASQACECMDSESDKQNYGKLVERFF